MLWFALVLKMILMTVLWPCNSRSGFCCLFVFLLLIRFHRCPVECVLQAQHWRYTEIDASRNGVSQFPDFVQTLVFAEGVRTGEPQGVLNKCYWVTSTLLLLNWTVGKWISSTNRAFHSSLLEGSNWRDWVTNNFIFNWIQQPSQVVNEPSESQDFWKFELCICMWVYSS